MKHLKYLKISIFIFFLLQITGCSFKGDTKQSEDFDDFMKSFGGSKEFQLSRIQFPLSYLSYDIEDNLSESKIQKQEWHFENFKDDESAYKKTIDAFKIIIDDKEEETIYIRKGIDNGIHIEYVFNKKDGNWYLVKILDKSV